MVVRGVRGVRGVWWLLAAAGVFVFIRDESSQLYLLSLLFEFAFRVVGLNYLLFSADLYS